MIPKITFCKSRVGRPKLGTEQERTAALLDHALLIFMQQGFANSSIAKIAAAAGVSTRTIYELYNNKTDLMIAAVSRMVERDAMQLNEIGQLPDTPPEQALTAFSRVILQRVTSPQLTALYRMGVAEGFKFPELVRKMQSTGPKRIESIIVDYLANQAKLGKLVFTDTRKSATLFLHMLISEPRHRSLFGLLNKEDGWDMEQHISHVVSIFLHGTSTHKAI
jgi:AcrR family transcriptional regulator